MFTLVGFFKATVFRIKVWLGIYKPKYEMPPPGEIPHFRAGDIWWCTLETASLDTSHIAPKAECRRPVLIYKRFSRNSFLGLQVTKQDRGGSWYEPIEFEDKQRWIMLHRPITLEAERLFDFVGCVDDATLVRIRAQFVGFYSC